MSKFEEFQQNIASTVGELIAKLSELPTDTKIFASDADLGGYDVCETKYVGLKYDTINNILHLGHFEYDAWQAFMNKEISREEVESFWID